MKLPAYVGIVLSFALLVSQLSGCGLIRCYRCKIARCDSCKMSASQDEVRIASWPDGALPGGTVTVGEGDIPTYIDELILPDNFTLKIDPALQRVELNARRLVFGQGATIDLSADSAKPPTPGTPPQSPGLPSWGKRGNPGATGYAGQKGRSGVDLIINVRRIVNRGSLWINTTAGPGGDGGASGKGQTGGGSSCGYAGGGRKTNGGDGGVGGTGGTGGNGGDTSDVVIRVNNIPYIPDPNTGRSLQCSKTCDPVSRPSGATGNDGRIFVYGGRGCPGNGGPGGPGGDGGSRDRDCFPFGDVKSGNRGASGAAGSNGDMGDCTAGMSDNAAFDTHHYTGDSLQTT